MSSSAVSLVVSVHDEPTELGICLRSLQLQTFKNFECIVVHEFSKRMWESNAVVVGLKDDRFKFYSYPGDKDVNDYGVTAKVWGTENYATGTVIGHINGDCYYTPVYLERMAQPILDGAADFTYCDWVSHKNSYMKVFDCEPRQCLIDSAGWLCRASVVHKTPWPEEMRRCACPDGWYVEQLTAGRRSEKVPGVLWVHT